MAQKKFDYDSQWKQIEKQEEAGLLKSMLVPVTTIYAQAKKDRNTQQIIRALLYQSKIVLITSDDDDVELQIVGNFEKEISEAKGIEKSVLQSVLAEMYFNYYQQNQWTINERTEISENNSTDFRFWTENIFQQKITELYLQSIENQKLLQKEPIANWNYILNKVKETENLRPTLYDLLAHRAIEFFQTENNYYYGSNYNEKSEQEKEEKIQQILNELISFHQQKNNQDAWAYNELELLKAKRKEISDEEFETKLMELNQKFPDNAYSPYLLMELSDFYRNQLNKIDRKDFEKRKILTEKSIEYSDLILQKFPKSLLVPNAEQSKKSFLAPDFNIQIENYVSPDLNIPIVVSHKNLDKLYFKIVKYNEDSKALIEFRNVSDKNKQQKLNELFQIFPLENEFQLNLKSFDDYQQHSTIAKLEPLKSGQYLILVSNNANFQIDSENFQLGYYTLNVTPYSIVFRDNEILVSERESGKFVPGINVEVYENKNNKVNKIKTLTTNELGLSKINLTTDYYRYLTFKIENEEFYYQNYYYQNNRTEDDEIETHIKFFTDRAIYRPGQIVYFKAILYQEGKNHKRKIISNEKVEITLYDTNDNEISTLKLKTNDFGSISGEFILPISGLTGEFYLEADSETDIIDSEDYYFSVEEYKRPRFEVEFEKVTDTFKLEEEITAKGKAVAYSGANIDNAKVTYRVYRQAIFPYLPWWKRSYFPQNEPAEEIAHGETITNSEGKFEIKFEASSPLERAGKTRTYTYRITADITDINGETRSSEQSITVGDLRYMLNFSIPEQLEISTLDSILIVTNNLNGQFVPAKGEISLTKINPPERILRNSPFSQTDYELYSKNEFITYFPNEVYGDENKKENWKEEIPVLSQSFDTEKSKSVKINPKDWKEGTYILRGFIVDGKDTIPSERLVYLYRNEKKNPVDNELFSITLNKMYYQPGETAVVNLVSATKDSEVLVQLEADGKIVKSEKIKLNNNVKNFSFPIDEKYRGNVFVHYYFGKFNTAKTGTLVVRVPYEDKSLKITVGTLRDKLQPGQNEIWELTVSGEGKDKFLAEMLATMYDASLDQFASNSINFPMGMTDNYSVLTWTIYQSFRTNSFQNLIQNSDKYYYSSNYLTFNRFNWFGFGWNQYAQRQYMKMMAAPTAVPLDYEISEVTISGGYDKKETMGAQTELAEDIYENRATSSYFALEGHAPGISIESGNEKPEIPNLDNIVVRRALQETAFFYPNLKIDKEGNVKIQFTTPESLTSWKFMAMAHTPDLRTGYFETTVRTQKDLMVVPNPPRFLREGDRITFSSKISNLSDKELSGQAKLMLFDAFTMEPIDEEFGNINAVQSITVAKGNSANVSWSLNIPKTHQAIVYRVVASAGDFSDGEESVLPILTNRMMVTETLPIHVRENQSKTFTLDKLKNNKSENLDNFKLTFEMTTNPIWYAIFSLPYLREYPYECSEQVFARLYGNLISQHIINSNPKIKAIFDDWNQKGELVSKLEQNQELKSILLEETPWVRDAQNEKEQMKRIAVLFDLNKMQNELQSTYQKLKNKQSSNGGFPWFDGGEESRYITTHIVSGFGHLKAMGIDSNEKLKVNTDEIIKNAIRFIDSEMEKEFDKYLKNDKLKPSTYTGIQYLYARSYFLEKYPLSKKGNQIKDYFLKELSKDEFNQNLQTQAMLALIYNRFGQKNKAKTLLKSIKDNSVESDEMGMYWKSNKPGWYWYQAPIETQALLIEAFDEVLNDVESVESMKVWLLKNRQTNQWNSTKATTEAVFALMNTGKDWTNAEEGIFIKIGDNNLDLKTLENTPQSGSGYVKTVWNKSEIKAEMAEVEVQKTSPGVAWGAMYWQYFEDLDKITPAETGVKFKKELFLKKNSEKGLILTPITENTPIQIGDLVTVRLEIQIDRDMEFVHIKDMRASGFEPINVLSGYKWQGGLGYYESTRDAATNFFIDRMPKGIYVFEYDLRANNAGNFSNGITSLQNMYAPELSAHSEGIRVEIE
ncbi:MAG: alpha-2-macroglobulin family protein [Weeksellaceae bacterium]|jgi:uncharacterized protein YfaS (alpha-2-macroglobulin family)|nr:alpha-2-macroglobulin family protein [Weeksellaceae bacterium]